jgi:hypothetical protein
MSTPFALDPSFRLIRANPPPRGVEVMTCVSDARGVRNVQVLRYGSSRASTDNLWWMGGSYVYYDPTHWKPL